MVDHTPTHQDSFHERLRNSHGVEVTGKELRWDEARSSLLLDKIDGVRVRKRPVTEYVVGIVLGILAAILLPHGLGFIGIMVALLCVFVVVFGRDYWLVVISSGSPTTIAQKMTEDDARLAAELIRAAQSNQPTR